VPLRQNQAKPNKARAKHTKTPTQPKKLSIVKNAKPAIYKKDCNYIKKRLVNVNKGATFAPATATDVH